ncbi:MAG: DUF934 domain-containing protein [Paludibacterium sp.]|uniref:DUF934 domain-containing protein n=1 Tax=Paludibacterium sp. TaxID=1917523 RepID=UPI0025D1E66B|nr:DUF934 domain-containing protein [Paludibacterium sp.]MBV8045915.1 DUF934 domain-containing protein [Paludibacterium sp.]MBV8648580.1 DUF934 domain-containing protein [Paludibacterium sp.]
MRNIIDRGGVRDDGWLLLRPDDAGALPPYADDADVIVPLTHWIAERGRFASRLGRTAVWLGADADPAALQTELNLLTLVAIDFPSFTDGRGYSSARLLRERYNYAGELRAIGDVWHDQLQALWLVGFDSFEIKSGKPLPTNANLVRPFSEHYQSSFRQPQPLFRRRINVR